MPLGAPASLAMGTNAAVSLGKHEPPKPGPARRKSQPMRPSRPTPLETCCTSAPVRSHRSAISLMKAILVARKQLAAYLMSSALSSEVNSTGVSARERGL